MRFDDGCISNNACIRNSNDDVRAKFNWKLLIMKRWILRKFFKSEMTEIYNSFRDVEKAINSTRLRKNNRENVDAKISKFYKTFIAIHE